MYSAAREVVEARIEFHDATAGRMLRQVARRHDCPEAIRAELQRILKWIDGDRLRAFRSLFCPQDEFNPGSHAYPLERRELPALYRDPTFDDSGT